MSQNPSDPFNPYSSHGYTPTTGPKPKNSLVGQFKMLGIIFIILSAIGFFGSILASLGNITQLAQGGPKPPPNMDQAGVTGFYFGFYASIIMVGLSIFFQPLILWAGINMLRMKGRSIIFTGAIIATIPMLSSCCFLGMPFGIWALILLFRNESKTLFS